MLLFLAWILAVTAVGRVALSWLPAGRPGYHELREMPLTLATSYLLGRAVWPFVTELVWMFVPGSASGNMALTVHYLPWIVLAFLRWATLPGALVPRDEPRRERTTPLARGVFLLAIAVACAPMFARGENAGFQRATTPALLSLIVISADGLAGARRLALGSYTLVLAVAAYCAWHVLLPRAEPSDGFTAATQIETAVFLAAGAAFAIRFVRHADRRAGVLAVIFFAHWTTFGVEPLALAAFVALLIAVPAPLRKRTAIASAVVLVLAYLPTAITIASYGFYEVRHNLARLEGERRELVLHSTLSFAAVVGGLGLVALGLRRARRGRETHASIDEPRREELLLVLLLVLGLVANAHSRASPWGTVPAALELFHPALIPLVPIALLWLGLLALGPEKARKA